ncbi:MAG: Ig-like domain-containing protein [Pirellulaceae bacterium]
MISGQSQPTGEDVTIVVQLSIIDPDLNQAFFVPQTSVSGAYGSFSVDANGAWSYDLDNVLTNSLDDGDSPIDSFAVQSLDGSATQTIEITIIGGADADTDGVDDAIEDTIGDGNADGVPDSEQDNVASLPNAVTTTTVTLAAASGLNLVNVIASDPQLLDEQPPADVQLPIGLLQFTVIVDEGAAADVRLYYDSSEPVNAIYKYGPIGGGDSGYYLFDEIDFGIDEFGNSFVELHLVDGGAGDADGLANGQIVDPVGLALAPGMGDDFVTTAEDQPLSIDPTANDVLSNPITIDSVGEAAHGTTSINVDGTVLYQPNENFFGNDAFTYSVTDANGFSGTAAVYVTVLPVNDAPTIQISTTDATKSEGQQATATGLFGDIDPGELFELSASIGDIQDNGDGTWSWFYTPTDGPDETQTVVIGVTDGDVLSTTEFPLVVNNVPVAFEAGEDAALVPADEGVFVRTGIAFTDPGTDEWTGTVDYGDGTGDQALTVDSDGKTFDLSHTYTTEGTFTVTVRLKDDDSDFVTDSFAVSVILNQPPVANDDTLAVNEDDGSVDLTGVLGDAEFGLLGNDSDPDGDDVVIISIDDSQISRGSIQLVDGRVVFDPNGEFEALAFGESDTQELVYTIADPSGETSSATAAIVVEGANDGPTISVDDATVTVDEGQTAENIGSFGDVDGSDTLILSASEGVVRDTGDGRWAWSWDTQDGPVDSQLVTITVADGFVSSSVSFQLNVTNVAPQFLSLTSSHPDVDHRSDDGVVTIAGEFDDPGSFDSHVVTIDWGDGTVSELSSSEITNRQFAATHTYGSGGVFDISVRIADNGGDVVEQRTTAVVAGMGLVGHTLFFVGTEGRDFISVRESGGNSRVQWNVAGSAARVDHVPTDAIDRMEFYTFDGHDHIQIRDHQGRAVYIDAGDGHNQISTEGSLDTVFAGSGNDAIDTGDGNDVVFAGAGDDRVNSGRGNDIVSGLAGDDRIWGGDGHDLLLGGDGRDRIYGDDGDDLLLSDYVENELHALALEQALIEWTVNDDIAAALAELGATSDDDDADRLYGNRGDDALFGGDGDRLRD